VPGFGEHGLVRFPTPGNDLAVDVVVQPDGRILMAGMTATTTDTNHMSVRRILPNGAPDPTFGTGGQAIVKLSDHDFANAIAVQPDGRIVIAGQTERDTAGVVVRLNDDGSLDPSFGTGGIQILQARGRTELYGVVVAPNGTIATVGYTKAPGVAGDAIVYRLLGNGRLDTTFHGTVTAADLAGCPLILMEEGTNLRTYVDRLLSAAGVEERVTMELDNVEAVFRGLSQEEWAARTQLVAVDPALPHWTVFELAGHFDISIGLTPMPRSVS